MTHAEGNGEGSFAARLIGRAAGADLGRRPDTPTLLVIAGLHGNEPAGVEASRRVLARLARSGAPHGEIVILAGNRRALAKGRRFLQRDLNRGWTVEAADAIRSGAAPAPRGAEDEEQRELLAAIDRVIAEARGPLVCLDLHTTSSDGVAFAMVGDEARAHAFARRFPLPVIGGLLGAIHGVLLEYLRAIGFLALGVEGGRHDGPDSADHLEAVLWLGLVELGLLEREAVPDLEAHRGRLARVRDGLPHFTQIHHRHAIAPEDGFRMEPGFANIQRVRAGELLARDRGGEIRAPEAGVLLMPLYQALGDDGFFLGREVVG